MSGQPTLQNPPVPLPPALVPIADACRQRREIQAAQIIQLAAGRAHVAETRQRVPKVSVSGDGETLYLGELSPGCQACKSGVWDCIFTHTTCNVDCSFCLLPKNSAHRRFGSVFGNTPAEADQNHRKTRIEGISFSGGEPLLDRVGLLSWLRWFRAHAPEKYYWVYTNGLVLRDGDIAQLAAAGLNEIRFNLAASGYDHPVVMKRVAEASALLPAATIEIPAIPEDRLKVLHSLASWSAAGVRFLNLHELMFEEGTNSGDLPGPRLNYLTEDGHRCTVHPFSRSLALAVMETVARERLPLSVNDCSMQSKALQLRGRRRCLAPLFKQPHEELAHEDKLESACGILGEEVLHCRRSDLDTARALYPRHRWFCLARKAPLSPLEPPCWTEFEPL
jgi:pyruvate formate-lyase activating enzyme-like uncharacterized protein